MRTAALLGLLASTGLASAFPDVIPTSTMLDPASLNLKSLKIPYSAADPSYNTTINHFDCGTSVASDASPDFVNTVSRLAIADDSPLRFLRKRATTRITVPTYIHVVTTQAKAGTITNANIAAQMAALNAAYNPFNIFFTLAGSDITANDTWAIGATDTADITMKQALRRGTYKALNLYMQTDLVGGILGKCSLPTNIGTNPSPSIYAGDGCNIAAGSMPGGPIMGYNAGMTAVHETGHWLGLLHTFEGYACTGKGDYVPDTAIESQSTSGCPTSPWKNTCNRPAGFFTTRKGDPIRNYMDYSIDACYAGFTQGQIQRINDLWKLYRLNK